MQREARRHDYEKRVEAIKSSGAAFDNIDEAYAEEESQVNTGFNKTGSGLFSTEDLKERRKEFEAARENEKKRKLEQEERMVKRRAKERKKLASTLSFADDDEVHIPVKPVDRTVKKDPTAATDFLPDKEREQKEAELRAKLLEEYKTEQEKIKNESIEITYSYWDGSGHRRTIVVTKGTSIGQFVDKCRKDLCDAFHELRALSSDGLMYIKEDLIIPHTFTFYDLIIRKARGKSGPLFHFDVHDDVRLLHDARIEKDESHAGKIVTRTWYDRNKHIFPASRWEVYDPLKSYEKYTIK